MSLSTGALAVLPVITPSATSTQIALVEPLKKEIKSEDYMPITDSKNVARFVKDYFADTPILAKIAACESHNRQYDSKGAVLRGIQNSYDRGVMQINILYHQETAEKLGLDLNSIDDNVAYARYLYEKQGAQPWISSSACWAKSSAEIALR